MHVHAFLDAILKTAGVYGGGMNENTMLPLFLEKVKIKIQGVV
jgi:hypothetical protein